MARTLIYDIETAPIMGTVWGKYEQNLVWMIKDWYMLCFAYKWLDEQEVHYVALPQYERYAFDMTDDIEVVRVLRRLFDQADIVVAHNGNSFDQKKTNARIITNGLLPPSPYKQIDTKLVAKRYFNFTSNKLDDLGEQLVGEKKLETGGYKLWEQCMKGDREAWDKMIRYNVQDVLLLEKIYLKMLPWINNHPAINLIDNKPDACPYCGTEGKLVQGGTKRYTKVSYSDNYQCQACGGWSRLRKNNINKNIQFTT